MICEMCDKCIHLSVCVYAHRNPNPCKYRAEPVKHGNPLTLEELRQMDGSPVWVEVLDHSVFADEADDFDGWGLVRKSGVRVWDEKRADLVKVDYHFEDYGKEWRACSVPVKHGRWNSVKNPQWPAYSHDKCSICGWWNTKNALCYDGNHKPGHSLNYCPNCGAKMDGGDAE